MTVSALLAGRGLRIGPTKTRWSVGNLYSIPLHMYSRYDCAGMAQGQGLRGR